LNNGPITIAKMVRMVPKTARLSFETVGLNVRDPVVLWINEELWF